ncbi:MAG: hypothetical protein ACTHMS_10460 [Jatrophihabitans sp.]|uniref:hypothetical protein n=1 Tax=Jatrophihabitans sp. TaxID=1932789 RepID=UPI003F7CFD4A
MRAGLAAAVGLGWAQLRRLRARWALLVVGIALVVAVPVITAGLATTVTAQAVRQSIAGLGQDDRTLTVTQEATSTFRRGTPAQGDAAVRRQLGRLTGGTVLREVIFRELTTRGQTYYVGAADRLGSAVRVTSGRLPRSCTPARCEVLAIGGDAAALRAAVASLGLDVVGAATRTNPLLVGGSLTPDRAPVLVAASVDGLARVSSLELFARYYAWVAAIDADAVVRDGVGTYLARSADVDATLQTVVGATTFIRPDAALRSAADRAQASTRRYGLLGGFAGALLLGFALVAGTGLRREMTLLTGLVRRRGGPPGQVAVPVLVAAAVCGALGAIGGGLLGGVVSALHRGGTGLGPVAAAGHALAGGGVVAVVLGLVSVAVVVAVLLWPDTRATEIWRLLDLVAVTALGAVVLAAARGSSSASQVDQGDPLVVALPVLAAVVAGLVAARAWAPVTRLLRRALPRRSLAGQLALLGVVRRPLRSVTTAGFVTAAVATVVFAGAYRATLLAGDADQAAFQVPLDATVSAGTQQPAGVVDTAAARAAGVQTYGVVRTHATITDPNGVATSLDVLAVDRAAIAHVRDWTRVTGGADAGTVASALGSPAPVAAPTLPRGARTVGIAAAGADPQTSITLYVRRADGREVGVPLAIGGGRLTATLPSGGPFTVVAVGLDEAPDYATHHAHNIGEGTNDEPVLSGRLRLTTVTADDRPVAWNWATWGSATGSTEVASGALTLAYKLSGQPAVAVPGFAAVRSATVPVVVDDATARAAVGGRLPFLLDGTTRLVGRVVGVQPRLPTVSGPFVLADRAVLQQQLDLQRPGRTADQYWLSGPAAGLDRVQTAWHGVRFERRASIQRALDADPVGRGSRLLLVLVALLALGIAAVALVLLVLGERRDGAGELFAWEADGVPPRVLRRVLLLRGVAVAVVAVPVGVVAGLGVAAAGARLVSVDATGRTPVPPLALTLGSVWTPLALLVGLGAGLVAAALVALGALREHAPLAAAVDLR